MNLPEYKSRRMNLLLSINVICTPFITIVIVNDMADRRTNKYTNLSSNLINSLLEAA